MLCASALQQLAIILQDFYYAVGPTLIVMLRPLSVKPRIRIFVPVCGTCTLAVGVTDDQYVLLSSKSEIPGCELYRFSTPFKCSRMESVDSTVKGES